MRDYDFKKVGDVGYHGPVVIIFILNNINFHALLIQRDTDTKVCDIHDM